MGWEAFIGQELFSFVPADRIVAVNRAIALLFSRSRKSKGSHPIPLEVRRSQKGNRFLPQRSNGFP